MLARVVFWFPVRSGGFFSSAHRLPLIAVAVSPAARSWLRTPRCTASGAAVAQATTWKASRGDHRLGCALAHHVVNELRAVGGDVGELRAAGLAQQVEEALQGGGVAALARPHQPAGVVVDDAEQVALPTAEISSIPIRRSPARRSRRPAASVTTRITIADTARQVTRSSTESTLNAA